MTKDAHISECGKYRYALWRIWDEGLPCVLFIGLNPSTADQSEDDPTVRKCMEFARRWNYGGIYVGNLFAYRATDPTEMKRAGDPVGSENDEWLQKLANKCNLVVAAWGNEGIFCQRSASIRSRLGGLHYLKINKTGEPAHPLYLSSKIKPSPFAPMSATRFDNALLVEYAEKFIGFGSWDARIWFIGIEEAGGWKQEDVRARLDAWKQKRRELEDAPTFYPASGNHRWHGVSSGVQSTWGQLIRMLLVARGERDTDDAILSYQRCHFGRTDGRECLAELLPLPSPNTATWNYGNWSNLPWLKTRSGYQNYLSLERAFAIQQKIELHRPKVVIFYASTWHRLWGLIARGVWTQAIKGKLMGLDRDGISFYVTRHPRAESDEYFREIGAFLKRKHSKER